MHDIKTFILIIVQTTTKKNHFKKIKNLKYKFLKIY